MGAVVWVSSVFAIIASYWAHLLESLIFHSFFYFYFFILGYSWKPLIVSTYFFEDLQSIQIFMVFLFGKNYLLWFEISYNIKIKLNLVGFFLFFFLIQIYFGWYCMTTILNIIIWTRICKFMFNYEMWSTLRCATVCKSLNIGKKFLRHVVEVWQPVQNYAKINNKLKFA